MLDFLDFDISFPKLGSIVLKPDFRTDIDSQDLMIRGGDFYAVWDENKGFWSTSERTAIRLIDKELTKKGDELKEKFPESVIKVHFMKSARSGSLDTWHKYVQKQVRDSYTALDEKIIFSNTNVTKKDYASKALPYPLEKGSIAAYEELVGTLYSPEERTKFEWAIGAIISGDAKHIQKFEVFYGSAGTGKSTVLNIIQWLFDGYTSVFNAKELASANNAFALESFKSNPLVSIQHDGDLSKIEDNTKLNSIVSHERMEVNAKYTKIYTAKFNTFLFMGTNKPVKITEAKSGILRRLIDIQPTGEKVTYSKYKELINQVKFELGAIAYHCLEVYKDLGESYYDTYTPTEMMAATNDFYDFVSYYYKQFKKADKMDLSRGWALYKEYCDFANAYATSFRIFQTEMKNYFKEYDEEERTFKGFRSEKFRVKFKGEKESEKKAEDSWLIFTEQESIFDELFANWPAQYAKEDGTPEKSWKHVTTVLRDLDTSKLHYVNPPGETKLIMADFDVKDGEGKKDPKKNLEAARKWPKTYGELSRSGAGIHLYYFYDGDVSKLSRIFDVDIEIKVFTGNASIRRQLSKCNNLPIATINTGLPLKGEAKMVNWDGIKSEKMLRTMIIRNLHKEYHPDTTSSVDYIKHLLDQMYESGKPYDVSDMQQRVLNFALNSTHQSDRCLNTVSQMKFKSEEPESKDESIDISDEEEKYEDERLVFFDCEVYSNFFCIVWKYAGSPSCVHMVNPAPEDVEKLFHYKLVGFNCRGYDNHILYAASLGYSNEQLYDLSQQMINYHRGFFSQAYDLSYTDVYDFSTEKMGLKKWEIKLDIHHQEMGIPWDQPVPEDMMDKVVEYCENDVRATEAVFNARKDDFTAREIQVDLVKLLHEETKGEELIAA